MRQRRPFAALTAFAFALAFAAATPAASQFVLDGREELAFDRPEAWAMAWFAAVSLPTALGDPSPSAAGAVELAVEGGWIPTLSEEQRTVGFLGTKPEDLNRTSAFGRLRLTAGLPGQWSVSAGVVPPVEIGGIEPALVSLAVGRPLWQGERALLGARLVAQDGRFRGDITCAEDAAAAPGDPERNPYNCEAPSRDELRLRLYGVELQAATRLQRLPGVTPYASLGWSRLDAEFQVDARYNDLVDRTRLLTDGDLWWATVGASWSGGGRLRLSAEAFYAPLDVVRTAGGRVENDPLLNARAAISYRLR